ncbi:hypothetical protein DAVIS_05223 [Mycobacterium marinum]|uniref:Uncharacterized protein n=1 Tax=Mycobacterium marinum TaxID=1781 RepID=A0A3E2MNS7_MYCMR|nr:hypothetical protein [Mycobacterium marinum]RFZ32953.1 hypothetical protein DAVIS_05223 [Mycobacterium marinum]
MEKKRLCPLQIRSIHSTAIGEHLLTALRGMIAARLIVGKRHARQLPQPTTNTDPDQ